MIIAAIILGLIALGLGILWLTLVLRDGTDITDNKPMAVGIGFWVFGFAWLIAFLLSLNLQVSSQNLSGYIYSTEDRLGYTTAHIRFSEQAGTDAQPSFCVKTDSEAARKIHEYSGSGKKVKVTVPSYFYFSNNPFACGTTKTTVTSFQE